MSGGVVMTEETQQIVVRMGSCKECGKPWTMPVGERDEWLRLGETKGYRLPRRCESCRKTRRVGKPRQELTMAAVRRKLITMSSDSMEGFYESNSSELAQDLNDAANMLLELMKRQK